MGNTVSIFPGKRFTKQYPVKEVKGGYFVLFCRLFFMENEDINQVCEPNIYSWPLGFYDLQIASEF